ncbi:DUF2993 domain-containing protein [Modestobacter sp. I12A-02628]|uniref:DUF2993 domain-containing protein n=1 Tax=Goekera deserti TaxID=2497753 RepID=A0A7K3WBJ1_9ACTN|nr:DUF2993 domain-containing protein [Goekera deserti]MPR00438.1 DUF2993 domain-containing protein [Goekera deserti]NDI49165.1 LmeA family phospholipid-binding protein [Goekera deserti]NEL52903.1 DUF2993 domain-containing protein [Goekera deserti]
MRKLLVVLLVLVALLVAADRVGVRLAEQAVARQLASQGGLTSAPDVDITGVPFLTQVLGGSYDDVRVALTAEELGQPAGTTAQVSLRGVHVPLSDLVGGQVAEVPVDRIDGRATLSYALLAEQLGGDATVTRDGDGLRVTRTVEVVGLDVPLAGSGTVRLDGQDVVVTVDRVSVVGVDLPPAVVDGVQGLLDLRYPVPELPFGLQVTGLRVAGDGLLVDVRATDAVLR